MMIRLAERELNTKYGTFTEILFYDGQKESIAIVKGDVSGGRNVLCRIHSACIGGHVFNSVECTCRQEMAAAQAAIRNAGGGVIIYLDQEGKGNGHLALIESIKYKKAGFSQGDAYTKAGYAADARSYHPAAKILAELGVVSVELLTENSGKAEELSRLGVNVAATRPLGPVDEDNYD